MGELQQIKLSQFWSYDIASTEDEVKARKRFTELFRTLKASGKGGSGEVFQVQNAFGETFACKVPNLDVSNIESKAAKEKTVHARIASFKQEYKNQATFCRGNNFPKVFGLGEFEGTPVMLMEWIDGGTITAAGELKQEDPQHKKVSPRIVAKIGIQLLQMIENLQYKDEAFVHRDISAGNIMFRTKTKSLQQQVKEEKFDLCLIDFGSSHVAKELENPSFTQIKGLIRQGTPEYAAPEMLTSDIPNLEILRRSTKIDSYAICSVLFELLTGAPPYDLRHAVDISSSWYLHKLEHEIPQAKTLHADSTLKEICASDKKIKLLFAQTLSKPTGGSMELAYANSESESRFLAAINKADAQLSLILHKGLEREQEARANPIELRVMLQEFVKNYEVNIQRAFEGRTLLPFVRREVHTAISERKLAEPIVLMQAEANPTHFIVSENFAIDRKAQLLFEKEKKKIEFSKGIFAFGVCLEVILVTIVSFCLNGTLYAATSGAGELTHFNGLGIFSLLMAPTCLSALIFLFTPKRGADIIASTAAIIATTLFSRVLMSAWDFVSEYVTPTLTLTQVALALIFVITICASRRQV